MTKRTPRSAATPPSDPPLRKSPVGIRGLDEILQGGLPTGRSTLVCGGAGSGKTLMATEFLVRGAREFGEPGVMMTFEETSEDLAQNVASLQFAIPELIAAKRMVVDHVHIQRDETVETGEYSLEGLFVRLGHAIDSVGAKRVALDSLEVLFASLADAAVLRAELRRLFQWLKGKGVTAIVTAERGDGKLTRQGIEEYVSDCVLLLDNRVADQLVTRRLRVVKYRGSGHGIDEYPFLIGERGFSVYPITSAALIHAAPVARIASGIPRLDQMLGGQGFYQGSSVLVSGNAGTGKTSIAAHLMRATCERGQRCLAFLFEESSAQMVRNIRSIGIDLEPWVERGLLRFHSSRPTMYGLEAHLDAIHREVEEFEPSVVVIDPITNLDSGGLRAEATSLLTRLIDFFKSRQITTLFTSLTHGTADAETSEAYISSIMDTWLLVRNVETGGERNRVLYVLKSRGMAHSNQVREFVIGKDGIELVDVYVGSGGVLTGAARVAQEAREAREADIADQQRHRMSMEMDHRLILLRAKSEALRLDIEIAERERESFNLSNAASREEELATRGRMAHARHADHWTDDAAGEETRTAASWNSSSTASSIEGV